jgi:parvulin-like peptidyl-prolyl isomerase
MLLQTEIEECQAAVVCNESRYTSAQCKAHADFEREMKYVVEVDRRDGERATRTQELLDMVIAAFPQAREGVEMWIQMERERTAQDIAAANLEASSIRERRDKRLEELRAMYEETKKVLIAQKECLKQVAKIGGVELYET